MSYTTMSYTTKPASTKPSRLSAINMDGPEPWSPILINCEGAPPHKNDPLYLLPEWVVAIVPDSSGCHLVLNNRPGVYQVPYPSYKMAEWLEMVASNNLPKAQP